MYYEKFLKYCLNKVILIQTFSVTSTSLNAPINNQDCVQKYLSLVRNPNLFLIVCKGHIGLSISSHIYRKPK